MSPSYLSLVGLAKRYVQLIKTALRKAITTEPRLI